MAIEDSTSDDKKAGALRERPETAPFSDQPNHDGWRDRYQDMEGDTAFEDWQARRARLFG